MRCRAICGNSSAEEKVEAEQREHGPSPDHQGAFPAEGAGHILLAAPGDQEGLFVFAFHQHHGWVRVETVDVRGGIWIGTGTSDCGRPSMT